MSYCGEKKEATVNYKFKEVEKKFTTKNVPIDVEKSTTKIVDPTKSCWRFTGKGVNNDASYELYACGSNAGFVTNAGGNRNLTMDGVVIGGDSYEYRAGTASVNKVNKVESTAGYITSGNCDSCSIDKCKLTIKFQGQTIFEKSGDCPLEFDVTCDDDCPAGSVKCTHKKYPGYCCVPCKSTASRINNLASKVGG